MAESNAPATLGARAYAIVRELDGPANTVDPRSEHFVARSAGRFIEEATELALAYGLKPGEILAHVADALHNEAKKANIYPSELAAGRAIGRKPSNLESKINELGDVYLILDYLACIAGIHPSWVKQSGTDKVALMERWAKDGQAHIVDGLFYRKTAGR